MGAIMAFIQEVSRLQVWPCFSPSWRVVAPPWECPTTGTSRRRQGAASESPGRHKNPAGMKSSSWGSCSVEQTVWEFKLDLFQVIILGAGSRAGFCCPTRELWAPWAGLCPWAGLWRCCSPSLLISVPPHSFFPFCLISKFHYLTSQFFLWAIRIAWLYSWQSP